ncbi:MAG: hypothetical protein WA705_13130 [Candidatus Ozemobacteraceae bacterium]
MKHSQQQVLTGLVGILLTFSTVVFGVTPAFSRLHRDDATPSRDAVLKTVLFVAGLMNAGYLGLNDLVAGLQTANKSEDPKEISAQLFAVRMGLEYKPDFMRQISQKLASIENYPGFPLGFPDSPEGPQKLSVEFEQIASSIENLNIRYESSDLVFLRKEANRVVFTIFWTESEKIRTMCCDLLTFLRMGLKEDLPFEIISKPGSK